jgi:protein SCO1/2
MINFRKAGLLIVTLVIPALVFVFLKYFGTNHYDLPHFFPVKDNTGKIVVKQGDTLFYKVPVIRLNNTDGKSIALTPGRGKITVVGYLPEHCLNTCQVVLGQMQRVFDMKEHIANLQLLTLADKWNGVEDIYPESLNTKGWEVLTGSEGQVKRVWNDALKLLTEVPESKTNALETKLVLIDEDGHIRGYYNASDVEETNRLMAEIKILDYEKKHK